MELLFKLYRNLVIFIFTLLLLPGLSFSSGPTEGLPNVVVPNVNETTQATGTFLGPLATTDRTYQMLINSSQLVNLVGQEIKGFTLRSTLVGTTFWPLADVTFSNYDVYLSQSVAPANRSLTFANNIVGPQTQVRSGPLNVSANSYAPHVFGSDIIFNTPYPYDSGHLLIEIRHLGFTGTSRSTEATTTSTAGYGTLFSGCWTGDYLGTAGVQGNFATIRLMADYPTLKLTTLIEGFYNGSTMVKDTIRMYLRNNVSPFAIVDSAMALVDSIGQGSFRFLNALNGVSYYLFATHRNSLNTWSKTPLSFSGNELIYDFTTDSAKAFGDNLKFKTNKWTMFSGDVTRDGSVNLSDITAVSNASTSFASGYIVTDLNGDNVANLTDITIAFNNASAFVAEEGP